MPQMAPCWWLLIQISVILLFMVVFVEIYFSFVFHLKSVKSSASLPKSSLLSKFELKDLLNE